MTQKIGVLFLSSNPLSTGRILVDEEAREVFERINEGPYRDRFELHVHTGIKPQDLQKLLLMYEPQIVHFSGHGSKEKKIILGGTRGGGVPLHQQGLTKLFALYRNHVRLVFLNACFTHDQARLIAGVVNYSIGASSAIGDRVGVTFAAAFYRALGFGKSVRDAFESARAELALTKTPRSRAMQLFVRAGVSERDPFPLEAHEACATKRVCNARA